MKWARHEDDDDISRCELCGSWKHFDTGCPIHREQEKR